MIVIIVVLVAALLASVAANRYLRPRLVDAQDQGMKVQELIGPMQTLTILLLAFVLVTASASYGMADSAARREAHELAHLAAMATYAPDPQRTELLKDTVCYARTVRTAEWPAMAEVRTSDASDQWSRDFRRVFQALRTEQAFGMLVAADDQRSLAREERMAQASPSVPAPMFWFLLAVLTVTVIALGIAVPHRSNRGHIAALVVITVLLGGALVIIRDVDRPFGWLINVPPTSVRAVENQVLRDLQAGHAQVSLPCGADGNKV
ncbi:hypothetical protein OHS33_02045 [Streptomyces sp. NBC_00536]|uniref:bestrophin-like domain n=1 Tax=Streptomyces sp. NBC_00536 TaxID=2975769 RepID=UPI002E81C7E8|nr:hypothetical protein [Streptomyces sp. NBC_00536]WUC77236.1 hypothetical protein OHS33_02045 [Streptomyces sp. NBC_00536]